MVTSVTAQRTPFLFRPLVLDDRSIRLDKTGHLPGDPEVRRRLEGVVAAFAAGYGAGLASGRGPLEPDAPTAPGTAPAPAGVPAALAGFAYEGAAMSRALLDVLTGTRGRRVAGLLEGPGRRHFHLVHVGIGWAYSRLRLRPWSGVPGARGLPRWLAWDGWGFHQAYVRPGPVFYEHRVERGARGPAMPVRDQGAGRALWFHTCADPETVGRVIAGFPPHRRGDLWSGVGLAAAYTGVRPPDVLASLLRIAEGHRADLAQGAAFAAKARVLAGEVPGDVRDAIETLCSASPATAAKWTDIAHDEAADHGDSLEDYQYWRTLVRREWRRHDGGLVRREWRRHDGGGGQW
ncbi:DUF1702 family protein [Actinomadura logoneensis]|uniref:DUF1702 family protein n=1 Tax=Actinomadura logoneensis TaxID=2293572 RepID=A0A372JV03_9ACTN|nr:DUF1702 family protein [Actinomadura logoneensis]RFU43646.1 DUF1702 family protein [Actinomadura logoneensis]